jgi:hypothetical protein
MSRNEAKRQAMKRPQFLQNYVFFPSALFGGYDAVFNRYGVFRLSSAEFKHLFGTQLFKSIDKTL